MESWVAVLSDPGHIVLGSWMVFVVFWIVSASNVKKDIEPKKWWTGRLTRLLRLLVAVFLAFVYPSVYRQVFGFLGAGPHDNVLRFAGAFMTVCGIALAIWARIHLGRNWSGHPTLKEGHELVTSGPYTQLRHPIYTGMLTALLGSVLASNNSLFIYFAVIMGITFVYRVHVEENLMMRVFPDAYPQYRKRTKALIPFVW